MSPLLSSLVSIKKNLSLLIRNSNDINTRYYSPLLLQTLSKTTSVSLQLFLRELWGSRINSCIEDHRGNGIWDTAKLATPSTRDQPVVSQVNTHGRQKKERTVSSNLLERRVEIHSCGVRRKQPNGDERNLCRDSPHMRLRPHVRRPIAERRSQLVREEQNGHGQQEDMSRNIMPLPQPWFDAPCFLHLWYSIKRRHDCKQLRVRLWRQRRFRIAKLVGDGKVLPGRQRRYTFTTREDDDAFEERRAKEPAGE